MTSSAPCKEHDAPDGARYCIQCGAEMTRAERRVLGYLMAAPGGMQPVFEYSKEIWERADFMALSLFVEVYV